MVASIALIDGTGVVGEADYDNEMRNGYDNKNNRCINEISFINRIYNQCSRRLEAGDGVVTPKYFRGPGQAGPTQSGRTCASILEDVKTWFNSNKEFTKGPIYAAGYSRGGYIAIEYAKWLGGLGLNVERMFLFDAVERDVSVDIAKKNNFKYSDIKWFVAPSSALGELAAAFFNNTPVPSNVKLAYHAIRDPAIWSRWYFDNCGLTGPVYPEKFPATHAAMGGIPWTGDHPQAPKVDISKGFQAIKDGIMSGKVLLPGGTGLTVAGAINKSVSLEPTTSERADFEASDKVWSYMNKFLTLHKII